MAENPFTKRDRERHEDGSHTHRVDYDLSSVAVALVNVINAIPDAREIRELRAGVKRALRAAAERL
jgi:hypothetical protein